MGPPKTPRSRRNVDLDRRTVTALREHRKVQRERHLSVGPAWDGKHDLVVCDELGRPIHPDSFSREFERCARARGLPKIRLHDLRHTHATLASKAGVHPKVVSKCVGHATISVTLDLYTEVIPSIAEDAPRSSWAVHRGPSQPPRPTRAGDDRRGSLTIRRGWWPARTGSWRRTPRPMRVAASPSTMKSSLR